MLRFEEKLPEVLRENRLGVIPLDHPKGGERHGGQGREAVGITNEKQNEKALMGGCRRGKSQTLRRRRIRQWRGVERQIQAELGPSWGGETTTGIRRL